MKWSLSKILSSPILAENNISYPKVRGALIWNFVDTG